jgi:glyoxylase-like metal-dependent hydrolase (beta-lactamase superfamily II)
MLFRTLVAGRDLRQTAEALFERPVETIVLTHPHSDHWMGASVNDMPLPIVPLMYWRTGSSST